MNKSILIMIIITFTLFCGCSETQKIPIDTDTTAMNNSDSTENEQSTPPEIDDKSRDILINNAGALTSHFIHFSVPSYMIENEISIGETEIWRFLMTTFATKNNPYASYCQYTDDGIAKPLRLAFGTCIIQTEYGFSDEETVLMIQEHPYIQFFCG